MTTLDKIVQAMRNNSQNVAFSDVVKVCNYYFGAPRQNGTSHKIYKHRGLGIPG